jgi:chromosome segregation ATPase
MFKENEQLLASVKALGESLAKLKEEQGQMQMHMEHLGSKKLAKTERANATEARLSSTSNQLVATGTQLALVEEEKNGKTSSLDACRPIIAPSSSLLRVQSW